MVRDADSIEDHEVLYRKVSCASGWYDPGPPSAVDFWAFMPNKRDEDGVSLFRAQFYSSPEQSIPPEARARGSFYVVAICASEIRKHGIRIEPRPDDSMPGHAVLSDMNARTRRESSVLGWAERIAKASAYDVLGPYPPLAAS